MNQFIQAIYEHGVFRPLGPVDLEEQQQVSLVVSDVGNETAVAAAEEAIIAAQRAHLAELREKMDSLPETAPNDGLGGADHDRILYGDASP